MRLIKHGKGGLFILLEAGNESKRRRTILVDVDTVSFESGFGLI
jgi:hypothetical protein